MRIPRTLGFAAAAVLGAAVVVLPAVAASETAPAAVVAENAGVYSHHWVPPSVTIGPGGSVEFSNPTETAHGIRWFATPGSTPACSSGVPVGSTAEASGTKWHGTCSFAAAGTYTYYCTVHGNAMKGTVTVAATQTTPPTTTTQTTPSTPYSSPPTATPGPAATTPTGSPSSSPLSALTLGGSAHGNVLHGSLQVSPAAAGGTLTVLVQARLGGHRVQLGRLTRAYLAAGRQSWSIALGQRARRALHARHRLAVTVTVSLTPPGGTAASLARTVTLHT